MGTFHGPKVHFGDMMHMVLRGMMLCRSHVEGMVGDEAKRIIVLFDYIVG